MRALSAQQQGEGGWLSGGAGGEGVEFQPAGGELLNAMLYFGNMLLTLYSYMIVHVHVRTRR